MKQAFCLNSLFLVVMLFICNVGKAQHGIHSDTTINLNMVLNHPVDLDFESLPGAGCLWMIPDSSYYYGLSIKFVKEEPVGGHYNKGGKVISTYRFLSTEKINYKLRFRYIRPWIDSTIYECRIKMRVE